MVTKGMPLQRIGFQQSSDDPKMGTHSPRKTYWSNTSHEEAIAPLNLLQTKRGFSQPYSLAHPILYHRLGSECSGTLNRTTWNLQRVKELDQPNALF